MQDCPVGWARIKRKVSRTATATFALIAGGFGGVIALESLKSLRALTNYDKVPEPFFQSKDENLSFGITDGILENLPNVKFEIFKSREN